LILVRKLPNTSGINDSPYRSFRKLKIRCPHAHGNPNSHSRRSTTHPEFRKITQHMNQIRIALVDDHALYRQLVREFLQRDSELVVVPEAENGQDGVQAVEEHKPDVVLLDISMPVMNGIDASKLIMSRFPATKVIFLSMYSPESITGVPNKTGAFLHLSKESNSREIVAAIKDVYGGTKRLRQSGRER